MFESNQYHQLASELIATTVPDWDEVYARLKDRFRKSSKWHAPNLVGVMGEVIVSLRLDELANSLLKDLIILNPIPDKKETQNGRFVFHRRGSRTHVAHYGGKQYCEYDDFIFVDGVPTIIEVKLNTRYPAHDFNRDKVERLARPIRALYEEITPGLIGVVYPEYNRGELQDNIEGPGGTSASFFASQQEYIFGHMLKLVVEKGIELDEYSKNLIVSPQGKLWMP